MTLDGAKRSDPVMPATSASSSASSVEAETPPALDAERVLRCGLISLAVLVALLSGLLLAVPGLHGVAHTVAHMGGPQPRLYRG